MYRRFFEIVGLVLALLPASSWAAQTKTGIPIDNEWKAKIYSFAVQNAQHVAWGVAHSERNYQLALRIADRDGFKVDSDVLFAAAFFHDIGAIPPYRKEGVEHEVRSVEVMEPLLEEFGFPTEKIPLVRQVVLEHMYYHPVLPTSPESKAFHDADALDFLGEIGIVRIVALSPTGHPWAQGGIPGAISTLKGWTTELLPRLTTKSASTIATDRILEMGPFFEGLERQSFGGKAL